MFDKMFYVFYAVVKKVFLFIIAGFMCLGTLSPTAYEEPQIKNENTGEYFLPDYGSPLISSHRCGKGVAPENTLLAIESNLEYASDDSAIMEIDVQITSDDQIVLYHSLWLDEMSDSEEYFGHKNIPVFAKTYEELRNLNMGEYFDVDGEYPYAGLRGEDIPDNIRITLLSDVFELVESQTNGQFRYIIEIKYPIHWGRRMVDGIYKMMNEYDIADRVVLASFWPDVTAYIDSAYKGKINRSANPFEIVDFYGCYTRNEELNPEDINFMCLQMPYYWDDGMLLVGNLGKASFIDYIHKYGLSAQYWTINRPDDAKFLAEAGADLLMTDYPERIRDVLYPVQDAA